MKYLYDFLIVIAGGLVVTFFIRTWDSWKETRNRPGKLKENCIIKIRHCINELDFNAKYVGGPKCTFKTEKLEKLLNSEEITLFDKDLVNSIKQLIEEAGIARVPYCEVVAAGVRTISKLLKHHLKKKIEELNSYSSSMIETH